VTYKQIKKFDYETILYSQFLCTAALYDRYPYRCIYFSGDTQTTLIVFSRTKNGGTITRHFRLSESGARNIITKLKNDFGIDSEKMEAVEADQEEQGR
jgi:hypothetical protein